MSEIEQGPEKIITHSDIATDIHLGQVASISNAYIELPSVVIPCTSCEGGDFRVATWWSDAGCPRCRRVVDVRTCPQCKVVLVAPNQDDCICPYCGGTAPDTTSEQVSFGDVVGLASGPPVDLPIKRTGEFLCTSCRAHTAVDASARTVRCACGLSYVFVKCPKCGTPQPMGGRLTPRCKKCNKSLKRVDEGPTLPFSVLLDADPHVERDIPAGVEVCQLSLESVVVVDGAGWAPPVGSRGIFRIFRRRLDLGPPGALVTVPLGSLLDIQVDGASVTTGGGFFGGGFGLKAAVEGMAIATAANALTTRTKEWVTVGIATDDGWVKFQIDNEDVIAVKQALRGLADWVAINQRRAAEMSDSAPNIQPAASDDLVSKLERLTKLRDQGALTQEEFSVAKSELLRG